MTLKAYCLFESHWIPGVGNDRGSTYVCSLIFPPPPTLHTNPRLLSGGSSAWLGSHQCHQSICAHGLGALQGEAQGSTPHQLSQHTEGSGHTEQHSVVIHLSHSIVLHREETDRHVRICIYNHKMANMWLKATTWVLPAAALHCGRRHWARGSWPYPAPGARWAQSYKAGQPT